MRLVGMHGYVTSAMGFHGNPSLNWHGTAGQPGPFGAMSTIVATGTGRPPVPCWLVQTLGLVKLRRSKASGFLTLGIGLHVNSNHYIGGFKIEEQRVADNDVRS